MTRTFFKFGSKRRLVTLLAWLILLPNIGFLPQTSHIRAMAFPTSEDREASDEKRGILAGPSRAVKGNPDRLNRNLATAPFRDLSSAAGDPKDPACRGAGA